MFSPYSAKAENLKARNNLTEVLLRDSQGYLTFERTAKRSTDLVSFEKDICWTVQCMLASDYLHNKQDLTKQISPHVPNILWLHFSRFILKSPSPCLLFFPFFCKDFQMPQCAPTAPGTHYWETRCQDNETMQGRMALSLSSSESASNMGKVLRTAFTMASLVSLWPFVFVQLELH